jgi:hypothetical protein
MAYKLSMTKILGFFHRPVFYELESFRKWTYFLPQVWGKDTWGRKQIQFPKRRVFKFLEHRMMKKVQKLINS